MPSFKKTPNGFTLIELMIVIAIIAILAAILIPNFLHARAQSQTAACEGNLKMLATAAQEYSVDKNGAFPTSASVLTSAPAYIQIVPLDPASQNAYTMTNSPANSFTITDGGGHDTTTTTSINGCSGGSAGSYTTIEWQGGGGLCGV